MLTIECDRLLQSVSQRNSRLPSSDMLKLGRVGVETSDVYRLLVRGPLDVLDATRTSDLQKQRRELAVAVRDIAANVEHFAVTGVVGPGSQECICGVVHKYEIAELRAVAINLDGPILDRQADEPADKTLAVVLDQLTRAVDVCESQGAGPHSKDIVVHKVIVLTGGLVDAVDIGRPHQVGLVDRQRVGAPIDLPCAGEYDFDAGVEVAASLEDRELAAAVDFEVAIRIQHAVDVADLPGEIENDGSVAHEVIHRALLADVCNVHANAIVDAVDVEQVAAVVGDQRVDEKDFCAKLDESSGEIAADEAEAAGDHHLPAVIELGVPW